MRLLLILTIIMFSSAALSANIRISTECGFSVEFGDLPQNGTSKYGLWGGVPAIFLEQAGEGGVYSLTAVECFTAENFLLETTVDDALALLNNIAIEKGLTEIVGYRVEDQFHRVMVEGKKTILGVRGEELPIFMSAHLMASERGFLVLYMAADEANFPYQNGRAFLKSIKYMD